MMCGPGQPAGSTAMTQSTLYPLQPGDGNDQGVNFCASPVTSPAQPLIPRGTYSDYLDVTFTAS